MGQVAPIIGMASQVFGALTTGKAIFDVVTGKDDIFGANNQQQWADPLAGAVNEGFGRYARALHGISAMYPVKYAGDVRAQYESGERTSREIADSGYIRSTDPVVRSFKPSE